MPPVTATTAASTVRRASGAKGARDLLLPLLLLPLTVPVVIAAAAATKPLLSLPLDTSGLGKWLAVLALYDLVFGLLAYAVFDFLMED